MVETGSQTFVFAGGLPGSGGSLLARCLAEHPLIGGLAGVSEDERQFRNGLDPAAFLTEQSPLVSRQTAADMLAEWRRQCNTAQQHVLVRSPENLVRTRYLQGLFPQSRFVMVMRDPIAVVGAMHRSSRLSELELLAHWLVCHERLLADAPGVRQLSLIRYEDLVTNPEPVLAGVFGFLGLEPPSDLWKAILPDPNDEYFEGWERRRASWRRRRTYEQVIAALQNDVARFGYSLAHPGEPVFPDRAVDALSLNAA